MFNTIRSKLIETAARSKLKSVGVSVVPGSKTDTLIKQGAKMASENWSTIKPIIDSGKELVADLKTKTKK
jgi:hypothetical protein